MELLSILEDTEPLIERWVASNFFGGISNTFVGLDARELGELVLAETHDDQPFMAVDSMVAIDVHDALSYARQIRDQAENNDDDDAEDDED